MTKAKDEEIERLKVKLAELEGNEARRVAVEEIDGIKLEITKLTHRLMSLADEHSLLVNLDAPFNQARGAGGMTYYGEGNPARDDDEWCYVKPADYGGWRSSATDMC